MTHHHILTVSLNIIPLLNLPHFVLEKKASSKESDSFRNIIVFYFGRNASIIQRKQKQIQLCKYKQIDRDKFLGNCGDAGGQQNKLKTNTSTSQNVWLVNE